MTRLLRSSADTGNAEVPMKPRKFAILRDASRAWSNRSGATHDGNRRTIFRPS